VDMRHNDSYYKDKKILITGGAGYIGSSLVKSLCPVPGKITVLDREDSLFAPLAGQAAEVSAQKADIRNRDIWLKFLSGIDIVFHLAGQTSASLANENPLRDLEENLLPVVNLVETCLKSGLRPDVIFSGTATEVGLTDSCPVNETFADQPITVYDIHKLAAEKYLQYYTNQMAGRATILRLTNVYGPGPVSSSADRGVLNMMVRKALKGGPLTVYGDGDFLRDYLYIDDVVRAFLLAGANMDVLKGKYYVIGSGIGTTIKDMVYAVREEAAGHTDISVVVDHVPWPDRTSLIEFRNFIADSSLFSRITGWKADIPLREGIRRTIDFFLKNALS
jgi:nucleoside-diphosphate-sugar epimerase